MINLRAKTFYKLFNGTAFNLPILYSSNYVWEIMHSTISKMSKHVEKLQKEAEEARDLLDAAKKKVSLSAVLWDGHPSGTCKISRLDLIC